jgi:hypothetical protein
MVSTNNTPAVTSVGATGDTYRWKVEYSGTSAFNAVTTCKELTTISALNNCSAVTNLIGRKEADVPQKPTEGAEAHDLLASGASPLGVRPSKPFV